MIYTQEITLDFNPNSAPPIIYAKQGDNRTRIFHIYLTQNDEEYRLNQDQYATLRIRKPDDTEFSTLCQIESDGSATATLSEQALAVAGNAFADLMLYDSGNHLLSTITFPLIIQAAPFIEATISSNEYYLFQDIYDNALSLLNEIQGYRDQVANIVNGLNINVNTLAPGLPATSSKTYDSSTQITTYTLGMPTIKPYATASYITLDPEESALASVVVTNHTPTPSGEDPNLQKSFDFSFAIPKGERGLDGAAAGFADEMQSQVSIGSSATSASVRVQVVDSPDTAKQFKFIFTVPSAIPGATGSQGGPGPQGPQGSIGPTGRGIQTVAVSSNGQLKFTLTDGTIQTVSGYAVSSAANFSCSDDGNGNLIIAAV